MPETSVTRGIRRAKQQTRRSSPYRRQLFSTLNDPGDEMITSTRTLPTVVYEDKWGIVVDHEAIDLLETRWYDTTADLTGAEFNSWLSLFVDQLERLRRSRILVDVTAFRMDPVEVDVEWRDTQIIPRYESAGVTKLAFHAPAEMPAVGKSPQPQPPASFPTGYFASRAEALTWLRS
jgi:hypothetical protein